MTKEGKGVKSSPAKNADSPRWQKRRPAAGLLCLLPMMALSAAVLAAPGVPSGWEGWLSLLAVWGIFNFGFARILSTGKVEKWRSFFFIGVSFSFIFYFLSFVREYAALFASQMEFRSGDPVCHLVLPFLVVPAILSGEIFYPGRMTGSFGSVSFMFLAWLVAFLTLGRAFCGWGCFFGGFDEAFSRLRRKPLIKKIPRILLDFPFVILFFFIILSAAYLWPVYCDVLCPFKAVFEPGRLFSGDFFLLVLSVILFVLLAVVFPLLTGKRCLCSFFCHLGAVQSLGSRLVPFYVEIDSRKCKNCEKCFDNCPVMAIEGGEVKRVKEDICVRCGRCVDNCPSGAISFRLKGVPLGKKSETPKILFLYAAFTFMVAFGGRICAGALEKMLIWLF